MFQCVKQRAVQRQHIVHGNVRSVQKADAACNEIDLLHDPADGLIDSAGFPFIRPEPGQAYLRLLLQMLLQQTEAPVQRGQLPPRPGRSVPA